MTIGDLLQKSVAPVNPTAGGDGAKTLDRKKLTDAAEQFEAMVMQELLKPMQTSSADGDGEKDPDAPAGNDTLSSYGTEAVAKAIAKSGGLGIARQIVEKVSLERLQHENSKV